MHDLHELSDAGLWSTVFVQMLILARMLLLQRRERRQVTKIAKEANGGKHNPHASHSDVMKLLLKGLDGMREDIASLRERVARLEGRHD